MWLLCTKGWKLSVCSIHSNSFWNHLWNLFFTPNPLVCSKKLKKKVFSKHCGFSQKHFFLNLLTVLCECAALSAVCKLEKKHLICPEGSLSTNQQGFHVNLCNCLTWWKLPLFIESESDTAPLLLFINK